MELTSTTVQPLAHYDTSQTEEGQPVAGPSSVSAAATTAFKRELEDRTFDVDDEEFELEAAFERGQGDESSSKQEEGDPDLPSKDEVEDSSQKGDDSDRSQSSSSTSYSRGLYADVFEEDVADAMIQELKEIGNSHSFPCQSPLAILTWLLLAYSRHVPFHSEICSQGEHTST